MVWNATNIVLVERKMLTREKRNAMLTYLLVEYYYRVHLFAHDILFII